MKPTDADPILLVEDNPNDVLLIRRAFNKVAVPNPLNVVGDGEKAIEYLSGAGEYVDRARYPLPLFILLDLKLPRKSGHEVVDWLRAQPVLRRIPVVVLTSSSIPADLERCYDAGVNSYLVKPVDFDELRGLIEVMRRYWIGVNQRA